MNSLGRKLDSHSLPTFIPAASLGFSFHAEDARKVVKSFSSFWGPGKAS
jgi:hypothetical protein